MTKFYFSNDLGRLPLNNDNGLFLVNVTGLGATQNQDFEAITGGAFAITAKSEGQGVINGEIYFTGSSAYSSYFTLVSYLSTNDTFAFIMNVNGTDYYRDVVLRSITKTEFNGTGRKAEISLYAITPWYTSKTYSAGTALSNQLGADFDIAVTCSAVTTLQLSVNGSVVLGIALSEFTGTVNVIGSIGDFSITSEKGYDLIDYVDLSVTTLPKLITDSKLTITAEATSGTATLGKGTVRQYFRSV